MVPKPPPLRMQARTPRIGPAELPTPLREQQALSRRRRRPLRPPKLPVRV
jgi:hypothetical protein